ncbi:MAG: ABC transporter permease [Albidovulum sp.]|nr:ABC transporter permease [Albidovulum sp.]MDE0530497.1 ABC transporter permease [Albidovulum sp.]
MARLFENSAATLLILTVLLVWQIAVIVSGISEFVLPSPLQIAIRLVEERWLLLSHAGVTAFEVLSGFLTSAVIGIPLALAIFYSPIFERAIYPVLVGMQTIPKIVLAPILVLYLGYGWAPKIVLAFLISFFPIVISTVVGLQSLDKGLVNLVRSMGATEAQIFFKIRLPAALPNIFGGFKVAISLAVIGAVIGEYIAADKGLGYLQLQANSQFDTTLNFAAVVVISSVGIGLYSILNWLESKVSFRRERAT